jgi:LPXTG-site transpeptidase (sortase) family protein
LFTFSFINISFAYDTLKIESANIEQVIYDIGDAKKLKKGVTYDTDGIKPGQAGNINIYGHRYSNVKGLKPHALTDLPKAKLGSIIKIIKEDGAEYMYKIYDTFAVDVDGAWIMDTNTNDNGEYLTIFTCAPMWSGDYRYAVKAKRVKSETEIVKSDLNYESKDTSKLALVNTITKVEPSEIKVKVRETFKVVDITKKKKSKSYNYDKAGNYEIKTSLGDILKVTVQ